MEEEKKAHEPTAEQLLKLLDIQLAALRKRREVGTANRTTMRVFSLCLIVFGAALALWIAMYMLDEMRPAKQRDGSDPVVEGAR